MFVGMVAQMPLRRRSRFVLAVVRDRCVSPLQRKYAQYENRDEAAHQRDSIIARTDGAHITFLAIGTPTPSGKNHCELTPLQCLISSFVTPSPLE